MPMKWVKPQLFLEYNGVKVYHTYKDNDFENRLDYWYTPDVDEDEQYTFDVRTLPEYKEDNSNHKYVIRRAIFKGIVTVPPPKEA
jgi:hypothetical protein